MTRSLKFAATPTGALLLVLAVWSSDVVEQHASATPPFGQTTVTPSFGSGGGRTRRGGLFGEGNDYPSVTPGRGDESPSPSPKPDINWGPIIGGLIEGAIDANRNRRPYPPPNPWQPDYRPWVPPVTVQPVQPVYPVVPERVEQEPLPNTIVTPTEPNPIQTPAEVKQNVDFSLAAEGMTAAMLAAWKNQALEQNEAVSAEIGKLIAGDAAGALAALADVTQKANRGALASDDLQAFAAMMKPGLAPGMARTANALFHRMAVLSRLTAILGTAAPGVGGPIPAGNRVPIVLVPGLPRGRVILLGNGAVLVGVGHLCRYVVVGRGNVAQCVGMTVGVGPPVPDTEARLIADGTLLINGEETQVNYNINGHPYTMLPRYRQPLSAGRTWVVAFDRGGSFGQARYTLSEGTYKFVLTEEGWNLYKYTFDVKIDNGENPFEFFYVVNNKHQLLPPGNFNRHSELYPLLVRFDNGRGQTRAKRIETGAYEVAVTQENTLDLFPEDAVAEPSIAPPEPNTVSAPSTTPAASSSPAVAGTTGTDGASDGNPFGGRGDWRPSLFVSDVPEVDYFGEPEAAGG